MVWILAHLATNSLALFSSFKRNGRCSNKLRKEISFWSRQGHVAHISNNVSSPPWTNIIKAQKYWRRWRKAEMDVIPSAALNQYLCVSTTEQDRLSGWDGV
jgi:hypothetical protein